MSSALLRRDTYTMPLPSTPLQTFSSWPILLSVWRKMYDRLGRAKSPVIRFSARKPSFSIMSFATTGVAVAVSATTGT